MGEKKCICAQKEQAVALSELNVKFKTFFFKTMWQPWNYANVRFSLLKTGASF